MLVCSVFFLSSFFDGSSIKFKFSIFGGFGVSVVANSVDKTVVAPLVLKFDVAVENSAVEVLGLVVLFVSASVNWTRKVKTMHI